MFLLISLLSLFLALIAWIFLLVWENKEYYKKLKAKAKKEQAKKEAAKKKNKEFKWPENLPHVDFADKEK